MKVFALDKSAPPQFSWRVHPARKRGKSTLCAVGVIALAAWLCTQIMERPGWGVFAAGVLVVALNRFFFPTRYELDDEGITARFPLKTVRSTWPELRRFTYDDRGGFLSPRARRSLLDEFRGISLLFDDHPEHVIQQIKSRLPAQAIVREVKGTFSPKEQTPCGG